MEGESGGLFDPFMSGLRAIGPHVSALLFRHGARDKGGPGGKGVSFLWMDVDECMDIQAIIHTPILLSIHA